MSFGCCHQVVFWLICYVSLLYCGQPTFPELLQITLYELSFSARSRRFFNIGKTEEGLTPFIYMRSTGRGLKLSDVTLKGNMNIAITNVSFVIAVCSNARIAEKQLCFCYVSYR